MLSLKQLQDVCLIQNNDSTQCRYLRQDDVDYNKWYCLRHRKQEKQKIDSKVNDFLRECSKKGIHPFTQGFPLGANCSGYPVLKHIEQGYDKD